MSPLIHEIDMSRTSSGRVIASEKETSVAVDPNNPNRLMAAANQGINGGLNVHRWYASSDGGRTFRSGLIPIGTSLTVEGVTTPIEYSDPWLAYGSDGTVYHTAIAHGASENEGAAVVIQASQDQGSTWTDPAYIVASGSTTPLLFHDKESVAVDHVHNDNIYMVWNPRQGAQARQIVFTRDLGGAANGFSFSPTMVVSDFSGVSPPPPAPCRNHGPNVIVDASGTIWVAWVSFCSPYNGNTNGDPGAVWVAKSTDQGQTFETPVKAATLFEVGGMSPVPGITGAFRDISDPTIASDPTTGRLFVAYATNAGTTTDPDIELVTSADGHTWSSPTRVNQDAGTTTQVQPSVAVQDGWLVVNFYTTVAGPDLLDDHLSYAPATASPSFTEIRLTSESTPQPTGFLGDYTAVAFGADGVAHAVWTDQRGGGDSDAYHARIDFSPPSSLSLSPVAAQPFGATALVRATVTGAHGETEQFIPVRFDVDTSGTATPESSDGTTDASGQSSFSYSNAHAGADTLRVWADLDEDGTPDPDERLSLAVTWLKHPTVLTYTGPTLIAGALSAQVSARLTDGGAAVRAKPVAFTLGAGSGAQTCSDATNLNGVAQCGIAVNQPLGPGSVRADFAGDGDYGASSATRATIVYAYTAGGNFVVGDLDASGSGPVTFWSSRWSRENHLTGGSAPSRFKGFANTPAGPTSCGGTWTADGGMSAGPPTLVPSFTAMLVSNSIVTSGAAIVGTKPRLVIVSSNGDYQASVGHPGTGRIVAVLCP